MRLLAKKTPTSETGIFYKNIVDDDDKEIDRVFIIRYRDKFGRDKLKTIGKYSQGIRLNYCKRIRDETMVRVAHGESLPTATAEKDYKSFKELADMYWSSKRDKKSYVGEKERYEANLSHLERLMADEIDDEYMMELQSGFAKKFAPSTVNTLIMRVNDIFNYATKKKKFHSANPCTAIERLPVSNERERYLSQMEVEELREAVANDFEVRLFVELALTTGGRIGTMTEIKKGDLDFNTGIIRLTNFKSGNKRYNGYMTDITKTMLLQQVKAKKSKDLLFDLSRVTIAFRLRKILNTLFNEQDTLDKDRVVIHSLRHTFASHLAISGVPIYTIQNLMNHSRVDMTIRYAKLAPDQGQKDVNELFKSS